MAVDLIGAWSLEEEPRCTYRFNEDRTFDVFVKGTLILEGNWDLEDGYLILEGKSLIEHYSDGFGYKPIDTGRQRLQMHWEEPELLTLYDRDFMALRRVGHA
jgi:hypothetical protein